MLKLVSLRAEKKQFASLVVAQRMERRAAISRMLCAEGRQTCNVRSTSDSAAVNAPASQDRKAWLHQQLGAPGSHQAHVSFDLDAVREAVEMQKSDVAKRTRHPRRKRPQYNNARREANAAAKRKKSLKGNLQAENNIYCK